LRLRCSHLRTSGAPWENDLKTLNDRSVKSLKAKDRQYDVRDAATPGLSIRVNANGTKSWSVIVSKGGRRQRITLGRYPNISLANARLMAEERKSGGYRVSGSVETVFNQYLEEIKITRRSWRDVEQVARLYMLPLMGDRKIDTISAMDGVELLDHVTRKSSRNRAAKTLAYLRPFFRWAAGKTFIPTNPWAVLVAPENTSQARERVLTDSELAAIWAFAKADTYPFGPFLQLLILTAQRRSEVSGLQWEEIDAERSIWSIPSARHKQKRGHEVVLSSAAIEIISSLPRYCDWLFSTTRKTPISGFGKFKQRIDKATGISGWRLHDVRRTAATRMAELQVPRFNIARILGHSDTSITATYDRASYRDEKGRAMEVWANFVLNLEPKK
jgi:integrase